MSPPTITVYQGNPSPPPPFHPLMITLSPVTTNPHLKRTIINILNQINLHTSPSNEDFQARKDLSDRLPNNVQRYSPDLNRKLRNIKDICQDSSCNLADLKNRIESVKNQLLLLTP